MYVGLIKPFFLKFTYLIPFRSIMYDGLVEFQLLFLLFSSFMCCATGRKLAFCPSFCLLGKKKEKKKKAGCVGS